MPAAICFHDFGLVSWSVTFLMYTVSGAGALSTSASNIKEDAIARTLPSGLKANEAILVGYLKEIRNIFHNKNTNNGYINI